MSLPPTVTEAEFLRVTERLAGILYARFGKLHGDKDDFHQQVCVWCLEAVGRFDPASGTIGAYLHRHVRNRSLNYLRDRVFRSDAPCARCHAGTPCGENGVVCGRYATWSARNQLKANIFRPLSMGEQPDRGAGLAQYTPAGENEVEDRDLNQFIDERLPVEVRGDYLRMLAGQPIASIARRSAVRRAVADILREAGLPVPDEIFVPDTSSHNHPERTERAEQAPEKVELAREDGDEQVVCDVGGEGPFGAHLAPSNIILEAAGLQSSSA